MRSVCHEDCWAKTTAEDLPGISVEQHGRTAGLVAQVLVDLYADSGMRNLLTSNVPVLAALHDVGKVSPGFQKKCSAWMREHGFTPWETEGCEEDHAKISQTSIARALSADALRLWAAIVGAHHGKLKGEYLQRRADGGDEWEAERQRLIATLVAEFGPLPAIPPSYPNGAELWFAAGLISVADWLASDEGTFPADEKLDRDVIADRVAKMVDRMGFNVGSVEGGKRFDQYFEFSPNDLQAVILEAAERPGIYVVEASMGTGKTEAALAAAYRMLSEHRARGIYFALPTQATSNRLYQRFAKFVRNLCPDTVSRLIHGTSWLNEGVDGISGRSEGIDWFASSRRALLAPFGIGTIDQALLGVLAVKHFFVRQFALTGKVVILDEVHSYDMYTGTLVDSLVRRLRELDATVIILSATLSRSRRMDLLGGDAAQSDTYPLITVRDEAGCREKMVPKEEDKRVIIESAGQDMLVAKAIMAAKDGACVLWISNTVASAQEVYRTLIATNRQGGPDIGLLHARFPQFERDTIEQRWLNALGKDSDQRPAGCVLVSTQIAEQSVDIDADLLITDIAPTDMLLQRIGRLWRHSRTRPQVCRQAETWVITPNLDRTQMRTAAADKIVAAFGKSAFVYAPYVLLRTWMLWAEIRWLSLPSDIRALIEATYCDAPDEPEAWQVLKERLQAKKDAMAKTALRQSNPWQVALDDEEGARTRWNSCPTANLFMVRRAVRWDERKGAELELLNGETCRLSSGLFDVASARSLHRNLVRVPRWAVAESLSRQNRPASWLRPYLRGDALLVQVKDDGLVSALDGEPVALQYRADLGIVLPEHSMWHKTEIEADDESYD